MWRAPPRLINRYTPTVASLNEISTVRDDEKAERESSDGSASSTRNLHSLRRLVLESGVMKAATGSSVVEQGRTKVIAQVMGPLTSSSDLVPSSLQLDMDRGTLHCEVKYVPHIAYPTSSLALDSASTLDRPNQPISQGKVNSWITAREADLSTKLHTALLPAVPLHSYPKCALVVRITILQDDGSILPACITAASLALADAAVEMYDMVCSCRVVAGKGGQLMADPTLAEETRAEADVTLAMMPNWKEVTLWEQSGRLRADQVNKAIDLCRDGGRTMHRFMREHLLHQQKQAQTQEETVTTIPNR